jgi:serine/threonine protein kinase
MHPIIDAISPCSGNNEHDDPLSFMVMEYIPNGSVDLYLKSNPSLKKLQSLLVQSALLLIELGTKYKVYQGDLNSGNLLLKRTKRGTTVKYNVDKDTMIEVPTHGIRPVLIDFGRGGFYDKKSKNKSLIMDDVTILFSVYNNWIENKNVKQQLHNVISKYSSGVNSLSYQDLISDITNIFTNT